MSLTETSVVVSVARHLTSRCRAARRHSRSLALLHAVATGVGRRLRASWLVGPTPEAVVVVDLRDARTVGPLLARLDRASAWAGSQWRDSLPRRLVDRSLVVLRARPVRVAAVVAACLLAATVLSAFAAGRTDVGGRLVALGAALLATRDRRSLATLAETRTGRMLRALVFPPGDDCDPTRR